MRPNRGWIVDPPSMITPRGSFTRTGGHAFSPLRVRARLTIFLVAFMAPATAYGQGLGHTESVLQRGPLEAYARAGIGGKVDSNAVTSSPTSTNVAEPAQRDSSNHHGSRARHAAVGAVIGGAVGLGFGIAADRPWLGVGESKHGHFNNLWVVTVPVGAAVGALVGSLCPAD